MLREAFQLVRAPILGMTPSCKWPSSKFRGCRRNGQGPGYVPGVMAKLVDWKEPRLQAVGPPVVASEPLAEVADQNVLAIVPTTKPPPYASLLFSPYVSLPLADPAYSYQTDPTSLESFPIPRHLSSQSRMLHRSEQDPQRK